MSPVTEIKQCRFACPSVCCVPLEPDMCADHVRVACHEALAVGGGEVPAATWACQLSERHLAAASKRHHFEHKNCALFVFCFMLTYQTELAIEFIDFHKYTVQSP